MLDWNTQARIGPWASGGQCRVVAVGCSHRTSANVTQGQTCPIPHFDGLFAVTYCFYKQKQGMFFGRIPKSWQ
ncbi:hypothetical protein Cenrod_1412 [Candidatus Symbiobacter mobilis CR]|uniref:Uncharacterized protein n=1 Tax=Candidatus Symbiobacter mobilis CR TaxID=946483 RepID=U5NBF0_9BURK|nr:hypothetical protein Cenrod_1412 [Candidatus Symbiobacter mobilis CR]